MDISGLLQQVDLVALAEEAGAHFNANLSSRCPLHGGDNATAFHIYSGADGRQRWHCFTRCDKPNDGDALTFWMKWRGVDFKTALRELAERAGVQVDYSSVPDERPDPLPAPAPLPESLWMARASAFAQWATLQLWGDGGGLARAYLMLRGLTAETIKAAGLGWNPTTLKDAAERWGFAADPDRPVWLHAGVTIPHWWGEQIQAVKIRCFQNGEPVDAHKKKYRGPRGGRMSLYGKRYWRGLPVALLVEGEFDMLLAWQEAGDMVDVVTLAGANANLDTLDSLSLLGKAAILAVYDADLAGQRGGAAVTERWPRAEQVQPPAHDLNDYWMAGGNLRQWIAGIAAPRYEALLERMDGKPQEQYLRWLDVYGQCLGARD